MKETWNIQQLKKWILPDAIRYRFSYENTGIRGGVPHRHGCFELVFHVRGDGEIQYGAETEAFTEGSWSLSGPDVVHRQLNRGAFTDICLTFELTSEAVPAGFHLHFPSGPGLLSAAVEMRSLAEIGYSDGDYWTQMSLNCRTGVILAAGMRSLTDCEKNISRGPEWYAKQAEQLIHKNGFTDMQVSEIAEYLQISPDYLRHCWRECRDISLKNFQRNVRLEYADRLLTYSELTVKEIAERCGFTSSSHFCAVYGTARGISPGNRRKQ